MTLAVAPDLHPPADPLCRPSGAARLGARDVAVPIPVDFRLESGECLPQRSLLARLHGPAGAPVVAVAGGISSGRFVHRTETNGLGWWSGAVGPRAPIDLHRLRVLAFDFAPGAEGLARPVTITTRDQARLLALALDHLDIPRLAAFVGCSYGGMIALAFGTLFPGRVGQLLVVSAAHRAHPLAVAWRGVQRRILELAEAAGRPEDGVALARQLAMTTYRTPDEFDARFDAAAPDRAGEAYAVCDYLISRGHAYRHHTTPARWISRRS